MRKTCPVSVISPPLSGAIIHRLAVLLAEGTPVENGQRSDALFDDMNQL